MNHSKHMEWHKACIPKTNLTQTSKGNLTPYLTRKIVIKHPIGFHDRFPEKDSDKRPPAIGTIREGVGIFLKESKQGMSFTKEIRPAPEEETEAERSARFITSDIWHQCQNGWWYWGGAAEDANETPEEGAGTAPAFDIPADLRFNWNAHAPEHWRATLGKGVKIAIIDVGFHIAHECFEHLQVEGRLHTFDANLYKEGDLAAHSVPLSGNDNVLTPGKRHGTQCLSIMAARPLSGGIMGVCPAADFTLIKAFDHGLWKTSTYQNFIRGLFIALEMGADIITTSLDFHSNSRDAQRHTPLVYRRLQALEQEARAEIRRRGVLLFGCLDNEHGSLDLLTGRASLPGSEWADCLSVGVLFESELKRWKSSVDSPPAGHYDIILPARQDGHHRHTEASVFVAHGQNPFSEGYKEVGLSTSFATPYMAGLAALAQAAGDFSGGSPSKENYLKQLNIQGFFTHYSLFDENQEPLKAISFQLINHTI